MKLRLLWKQQEHVDCILEFSVTQICPKFSDPVCVNSTFKSSNPWCDFVPVSLVGIIHGSVWKLLPITPIFHRKSPLWITKLIKLGSGNAIPQHVIFHVANNYPHVARVDCNHCDATTPTQYHIMILESSANEKAVLTMITPHWGQRHCWNYNRLRSEVPIEIKCMLIKSCLHPELSYERSPIRLLTSPI